MVPLFDRPGPVFVKRGSDAAVQLAQMRELLDGPALVDRKRLKKDIGLLEAGIFGEQQIAFELENSRMPLHVLQDLRLEHDRLTGQIDFLVITPHVNLVIECKNLFGNITISRHGEWIREFDYGTGPKKEGIYSPVTQNERHLQLLKAVRQADKGLIFKLANDRWFDSWNHSIIVLANHKTILKADEAHRRLVVRADGLVERIKKLDAEHKDNGKRSAKEMEGVARYWLSRHVEKPVDIAAKYRLECGDTTNMSPVCPECGSGMVLRTARRGKFAGREFYGCSQYPKCKGTANV